MGRKLIFRLAHLLALLLLVVFTACAAQEITLEKGMPPIVSDYLGPTRLGERRRLPHTGIDIDVRYEPVLAAADGIVTFVGFLSQRLDGAPGNIIAILHGQDVDGSWISTGYLHLDSFKVSYGMEVKRGQLIAISGQTGDPPLTRGPIPHLHYTVFKTSSKFEKPTNEKTVNPHEFWVDGKPSCFDPNRAYPLRPIRFTYPVTCRRGGDTQTSTPKGN